MSSQLIMRKITTFKLHLVSNIPPLSDPCVNTPQEHDNNKTCKKPHLVLQVLKTGYYDLAKASSNSQCWIPHLYAISHKLHS